MSPKPQAMRGELPTPNESRPVTPQDAATVVVLRESAGKLEMFCVERHARSGFLGGAIVFPGGKVDPGDEDDCWLTLATPLLPRARELAQSERMALALAVAGLRELLEEGAIFPAENRKIDAVETLLLREELMKRQKSGQPESRAFGALIAAQGLELATGKLEGLWRWITPMPEARRYDTRFYVLSLPDGQSGQHDRHETTSSFWATPSEVLERWTRREIMLAPPTLCTVELFVPALGISEALGIARAQSLEPIRPFVAFDAGEMVLAMPGDPLYPGQEPPIASPAIPARFVLEKGRLVGRRSG